MAVFLYEEGNEFSYSSVRALLKPNKNLSYIAKLVKKFFLASHGPEAKPHQHTEVLPNGMKVPVFHYPTHWLRQALNYLKTLYPNLQIELI
tara:strand:- start:2008 stop:2280 length:273 start_codon:yes stop_codon:yes gene_type:complete